MVEHDYYRLTDELERRLMLEAIEEQFRPRPLRALGRGLRKLASFVRAASKAPAGNTQTQTV